MTEVQKTCERHNGHHRKPEPRKKKVSAAYVERAALHYLGRFSSTAANLEKILFRKIQKRLLGAPHSLSEVTDEHRMWVADVVGKCVRLGYVNDAAYAENRANLLIARGKGPAHIRQDLRFKGVPADIVEQVLSELSDAPVSPEFQAAVNYARRRRFGPYAAQSSGQAAQKPVEKQLQAMARAGIPYEVAKTVLFAESVESLEEQLVQNHTDEFI